MRLPAHFALSLLLCLQIDNAANCLSQTPPDKPTQASPHSRQGEAATRRDKEILQIVLQNLLTDPDFPDYGRRIYSPELASKKLSDLRFVLVTEAPREVPVCLGKLEGTLPTPGEWPMVLPRDAWGDVEKRNTGE